MSGNKLSRFNRSFYGRNAKENLRKIKEFQDREEFGYLKDDVLSGEVYPALRKNTIDFYYMDARLCHYGGGKFCWHNTTLPCKSADY